MRSNSYLVRNTVACAPGWERRRRYREQQIRSVLKRAIEPVGDAARGWRGFPESACATLFGSRAALHHRFDENGGALESTAKAGYGQPHGAGRFLVGQSCEEAQFQSFGGVGIL
jgi:hypothetical protein